MSDMSVIKGEICQIKTTECYTVSLDMPHNTFQLSDVDYSVASQYFAIAFSTTVGVWLFSKCVGYILKLVNH